MRVVNAEHPSIGYSSETVLVDLASTRDGGEQTHDLVVRLAPPTAGTFRDYDLAAADDRAARRRGGRCRDRDAGTRHRPAMARCAVRRDAARARATSSARPRSTTRGCNSLDRGPARAGARGIRRGGRHDASRRSCGRGPAFPNATTRRELDFWADYLDWSSGGTPLAPLVDALEWCRAHRPATESEPVLLWGDVRLGNVIFGDDLAPRAVLDWDMASIGAREHDVAWFTTLESTMRSLLGKRLAGFPDRDGTIAQYESLSGHTLHDLEWYEILALTRSTAILAAHRLPAPGRRIAEPVATRGQPAPRSARRTHRRRRRQRRLRRSLACRRR